MNNKVMKPIELGKLTETAIDTFVNALALQNAPDNFSRNPYQGNNPEDIDRRYNLTYYLKKMQELNPSCLFIGEAPGRWGCYVSGVPFTDENTLLHHDFFKLLDCNIKRRFSEDSTIKPLKENSANVVWERLDKIPTRNLPLMWNIYPFHPSSVVSEYSAPGERPNRKPTHAECQVGRNILKLLLNCFEIKQIYAIGRTAEAILKNDFPDIKYIRHPSMGGINEFRNGFNKIYLLR